MCVFFLFISTPRDEVLKRNCGEMDGYSLVDPHELKELRSFIVM